MRITTSTRTPGDTGQRRGPSIWTHRTGLGKSHVDRIHLPLFVLIVARVRALDQTVVEALRPFTLPALRVLLGLVFIWFGGLKVIGRSPVAGLVAQTLPFGNHPLVMLVLGTMELLLGVVLICGVLVRVALLVLAIHLAGTFSTFVVAPQLMFSGGDPLLLTGNGEFVAKNAVLIAATLVLITHTSRTATMVHPASEAVMSSLDTPR
jgi:uncharacterized membrane protein YphA (DoxX/SURF4 family)